LAELKESEAELLILLGDEPIRHFMRPLVKGWTRLADFEPYGEFHEAKLAGRDIQVLALAHPRQVAKLGSYNKKWYKLHKDWLDHRS